MKTILITLLALAALSAASAQGQVTESTSFIELGRAVKAEPSGWSGSKQPLATLFNAERQRLGERFETELLKYIGTDVEKHYWISLFLTEPSYLHGQKPLPGLSLQISDKALSLLSGKEDDESLCYTVRISVAAAVISKKNEEHSRALAYRQKADALLLRDPDSRVCFPGMSKEERKLYDSIAASGVKGFPASSDEGPPAQISGGILNAKAVSLPKPAYPAEAKAAGAAGEVTVRIVFDESGKVIWAKMIKGHQLLKATSEAAAAKARFSPLIFRNKPVRVSGVLIYNFTR